MPQPQEQIHDLAAKQPVQWGSVPEGPDWAEHAARRIAGHAAGGDRGAVLQFVHELEHELGSHHLHGVSPWRVLEHLAARITAAGPDSEPPAAEPSAAPPSQEESAA